MDFGCLLGSGQNHPLAVRFKLKIVTFQVNIPLFNTPMVDLLAKVKPIELFPMVWVDGTADIDEARILNFLETRCSKSLSTTVQWEIVESCVCLWAIVNFRFQFVEFLSPTLIMMCTPKMRKVFKHSDKCKWVVFSYGQSSFMFWSDFQFALLSIFRPTSASSSRRLWRRRGKIIETLLG